MGKINIRGMGMKYLYFSSDGTVFLKSKYRELDAEKERPDFLIVKDDYEETRIDEQAEQIDGMPLPRKSKLRTEIVKEIPQQLRKEWCQAEIKKLYTTEDEFKIHRKNARHLNETGSDSAEYIKYDSDIERIISESQAKDFSNRG